MDDEEDEDEDADDASSASAGAAASANEAAASAARIDFVRIGGKRKAIERPGVYQARRRIGVRRGAPQGEISDVSTIEKGSLLLKRRFIKQGPMTIEMNVAPNKLTGSTTMNGQSKPIDADPGGALFADGAGTFEVIASLPLADGYSLSFRNFDVQKQKPQMKQLKVLGTESVTVPAGTFDAYKVEILSADNDADKQTVWIDKGSRKVLKISAVLPSLNGAVLTSELTP